MTTERTGQQSDFAKEANTGLTHLVNATRFSFAGLQRAFKHESAFRQELLGFAILLPSGAWLSSSVVQLVALVCACCLVLLVELLNSGIEAAVDRTGTEYHELAKAAKDYGSAAVMMSLVIVGVIWTYIAYAALVTNP